ncbi:MAG: uracil-DNA glycosylase family protein [Burkholderiaceae bacterium]
MSDKKSNIAGQLTAAAKRLRTKVNKLQFAGQVCWTYNPLDYAWAPHQQFITRFGNSRKRVLFLGMNPGPFGMMQTGIPFGEVAAVRDWMQIDAPVDTPASFHPKRPIQGMACTRSEVSGRRLWGWAQERFGSAENFFTDCFVVNYCPLVFLGETGRNLTPDKLPAAELAPLQAACDEHLLRIIQILSPEWTLGVGGFAAKRLSHVLGGNIENTPRPASDSPADGPRIGQILHPSPASPLANRGWAPAVEKQLAAMGLFQA